MGLYLERKIYWRQSLIRIRLQTCNFVAIYPVDGEVDGQRIKQADGFQKNGLLMRH